MLDPTRLIRAVDFSRRPLTQHQKILRVALEHVSGIWISLEHFHRPLADRLEHRETPIADRHEAVLDQHLQVRQCVSAADDQRRLEVKPARERTELREQLPLRVAQQRQAPLERRPQAPLMLRQIPRTADQRVQRCAELHQQACGGEQPQARRGQFQRQRQPVQPSANLRDQPSIIKAQLETRADRAGPLREELRGRVVAHHPQRRVERWQLERAHGVLVFTTQAQRAAAGDEDFQLRASLQQFSDLRCGRYELLEIVEHQQQRLGLQCGFDSR